MSQESLNSNSPWENEELTEAELDALAGGGLLLGQTDPFSTDLSFIKTTDSNFTSFFGTRGTNSDYDSSRPLNTSLLFP